MSEIKIFTDGASRGNPGPGGWGAVILNDGYIKELGGREDETTNNRMELSAIIGALKILGSDDQIKIFTDSKYVIQGATQWINNWKRNGWMTKNKTEVLNKDLWEAFADVSEDKNISWVQLEGHAGIPGNEKADEIATKMADNENFELYEGEYSDYGIDLHNIKSQYGFKIKKDRSKMKAYSYLSMVDGIIEKHATWPECEARVKGKSGVKFKKSISPEDELEIIEEWKKQK